MPPSENSLEPLSSTESEVSYQSTQVRDENENKENQVPGPSQKVVISATVSHENFEKKDADPLLSVTIPDEDSFRALIEVKYIF